MTSEGRALLTEREKEILSGQADVSDNYQYKVKSIIRTRISEHFSDDLAFLKENFPEAYDLIVEKTCDEHG